MVHALVRSPRSCSFTALLCHLISPLQSPPRPPISATVYPTSSGTRRIRGISYLAQIQSHEYNFPREQSFIVIVNPSVNCPALSITAVRRYNSAFCPPLCYLSNPRLPFADFDLAVIHRRCSRRDEDEDGGRRVKGLYELIRVEGVMIEGVDGRELPFPKRLLREETKRYYNTLCSVIRSNEDDRSIPFARRLYY